MYSLSYSIKRWRTIPFKSQVVVLAQITPFFIPASTSTMYSLVGLVRPWKILSLTLKRKPVFIYLVLPELPSPTWQSLKDHNLNFIMSSTEDFSSQKPGETNEDLPLVTSLQDLIIIESIDWDGKLRKKSSLLHYFRLWSILWRKIKRQTRNDHSRI